MSKQTIDIGAAANDNSGDTLRDGATKINANFSEVYGTTGLGNNSELLINVSSATDGQVLRFNSSVGKFVSSNYTKLTSSLDTNGQSIVSASNANITIDPNGTGDLVVNYGTATATFDGATNVTTFSGPIIYDNEYNTISAAPAASETGYFYTVNGDDNPYVNINITSGGTGNVRASLLTEYSSIGKLSDVDGSIAPTADQVLKFNATSGKYEPADDGGGGGSVTQNLFATFAADTGSTTANSATDTITITGGTNITTSITGDAVTVNFAGTIPTTATELTDVNLSSIVQGNSLYWNGTSLVPTTSPMIWWELNANGNADYTVTGPGFTGTASDPTFYVYRGFTYAFDNSIQGGGHPFRIQSTQGLSGSPYTTGQTGSSSNILYWTVPMDAPNTLYYQCTLHSAMQGTINVVS